MGFFEFFDHDKQLVNERENTGRNFKDNYLSDRHVSLSSTKCDACGAYKAKATAYPGGSSCYRDSRCLLQEEEAKGNSMTQTDNDTPNKQFELSVWLHHQHPHELTETEDEDRNASMLGIG